LRRKCLLKHVIEGKIEVRIEVTGLRGKRRKQLLEDLMENRVYWKLKEETIDLTVWRTRSIWRRPRTCRQTDCGVNEFLMA
jgi:hypothetical protein